MKNVLDRKFAKSIVEILKVNTFKSYKEIERLLIAKDKLENKQYDVRTIMLLLKKEGHISFEEPTKKGKKEIMKKIVLTKEDICSRFNVVKPTPKVIKELEDEGYTKHKEEEYPFRVTYYKFIKE